MSPEYSAPQPDNPALFAQRRLESDITRAGSVEQYLHDLQLNYAVAPDGTVNNEGKAELLRLRRAAHFIVRDTPQRQNYNQAAALEAFYNGELLAYGYISELVNKHQLPSGLAHSFLKSHLDHDRPKPRPRPNEDADDRFSILYEKGDAHQHRLDALSTRLYTRLAQEILDPQSIPAHLPFAAEIIGQMNLTAEASTSALIGFHMIMREYEQPAFVSSTTEHLIGSYTVAPPATATQENNGKTHIQSVSTTSEYHQPIPTLNDIASVVGPFETPLEVELPKYIIKTLRQKTAQLLVDFKDIIREPSDPQAHFATMRFMETELNGLNRKHQFITPNELLIVDGEYFAHIIGEGGEGIQRFSDSVEIHGTFTGIHVVEVPSNKELLRVLNAMQSKNPDPEELKITNFVISPVLRIANPVFVSYPEEGEPTVDHEGMDLMVDIPLVYKEVHIRRLES